MSLWIPDISERPGTRYRAIADAIEEAISLGRLAEGDKLPAHRDMAWRLGVTIGTVAKAYKLSAERGLLVAQVGSGTRVAPRHAAESVVTFQGGSAAADLGLLLPAPIDDARVRERAFRRCLGDVADTFLAETITGYSPEFGLRAHREAGARFLGRFDITCDAGEIVVTSGAQEAFMILIHSLTEPGDVVLTEEVTYFAFKHLCAVLNRQLAPVHMDEAGMVPDALEAAVHRHRAELVFTCPTVHNPTGTIVPAGRRRELTDVMRRLDLTVIEDNPFGALYAEAPPTFAELAPERVYLVSSISKYASPTLRIAYIKASARKVEELETIKHALTIGGSYIHSEVAARWIEGGILDDLIRWQTYEIGKRWQTAKSILGPDRVPGELPLPFLWLDISDRGRPADFVEAARRAGVRVIEGAQFAVGSANPHKIRVALTTPRNLDKLASALERLLGILEERPQMLRMIY